MKKEDLRLLLAFGEGYYTGATRQWAVAYDVNYEDELKNNVKEFKDEYTPCFAELDGKFSEVEGECEILDSLLEIVDEYNRSDDEFDDLICYHLDKNSDLYKSLEEAQRLVKSMTIKEMYKHKKTGETIDLADYTKVKCVVE